MALYARIVAMRQQADVDGHAAGRLVLDSAEFRDKFDAAWRAVAWRGGRAARFPDEMRQAAMIGVHRYFVAHGLGGYTDAGEDEFGGWLYALCKRHIGWAVRRVRLPGGGDFADEAVVVGREPPAPSAVPAVAYERAWTAVSETMRAFPEPLRTVMADYFAGSDREYTARTLGLSANWVSQLRAAGKAMLLRVVRDQGDGLAS